MAYHKFLTRCLPILVVCLLAGSALAKAGGAGARAKKRPPNIILIFMDDMGYGDVDAYGGIAYHTPHIDKLANQGMRFTNFYAVQPTCTVSRAGLLTGTYPNRLGLYGAIAPNSKVGLSSKDETIASMLKKKGYATGVIGKWHVGDAKKFLPLQHGFDYWFGLPYSNDMWPHDFTGKRITHPENRRPIIKYMLSKFPPLPLMEGKHTKGKPIHYKVVRYIRNMHDQGMLTTWYTQKAVNFIKRHKHQPFFLYLPQSMVHVPIAVSNKFKGKSKQGLFGDVMEEIDWSAGQVMKTLKENGLKDNTIVIFASDNGPWLKFGNHAGSAGGLREGKHTTFEGGQREPAIMRWPGRIPAGTVNNKLASTIDMLPTVAAITGAPLPTHKIDGVNILSLLKGKKNADPRSHFYYYFHKNDLEAVRQGRWKLILPHQYTSVKGEMPGKDGQPGKTHKASIGLSLYNLRRDAGERYNVIKAHPEVVKKIMKLVEHAREDMGDALTNRPGKNRRPPGRCSPCRYPGLPASAKPFPTWSDIGRALQQHRSDHGQQKGGKTHRQE